MKGDADRVLQAGCNAHGAKPFDIHELHALIERILAGRPAAEAP